MKNYKTEGMIFDIQSFSLHDGPGIRTLIFLKGCPLKCKWCANPEGQDSHVNIRHYKTKCLNCLECVDACNKGAISNVMDVYGNKSIEINREKCINCNDLKCVEACLHGALEMAGKVMNVDEVMKVVKREMPYYRARGGVTLSGGDPTYQIEFAVEILRACKDEYINTAIESAMYLNGESLKKLIPHVDLFLIDIKHMDSDKHKELTGVENNLILENISTIAKQKLVLIRIPIISSFNDDDENIINTARFCKKNNIGRINILPYHKLGQSKYEQLGLEYTLPELSSPTNSKMLWIKKLIESCGITCVIG
ncbi:MAG: indoleacetate decarboxylase activase [Tissierellales bacterium]|jgi:pyruvate formate lyase activating enzyme|nr:indoleacetate decarboxylase activase [Tissierellales bacterium]